jgi:signal transduction histidine kinase
MKKPVPWEDNLVIRHGSTSETKTEADQTNYGQENPVRIGGANGAKAPATRVYEDKHGLPVLYEETAREAKPQPKAETNTISVLWHELISPLTVIKGYTATLLELKDAITEEQKEQYLRGIDSASNRVIRLQNLRTSPAGRTDAINLARIS